MTSRITGPAASKQARTDRGAPHRRRTKRIGRFLVATGAAALALHAARGLAGPLESDAASPWASSGHVAARLVAAGGSGMDRLAAIEIRLDPGFITYWRNPGEAGLPPTLDTAASINVAGVGMDFPTPRRLDEGGAVAFGYTGHLALPLHVTLADAARPATLMVDLDYAVCSAVCLPAKAHLALALPAGPTPAADAVLANALAQVPRPVPLGAPGPLGIDRVTPPAAAGPPTLTVAARAGPGARLFVEAPDGWYVEAGDPVAAGPGRVSVPVAIVQRPTGAPLDGLALRFTLADADGAVDTSVRMDEAAAKP